MNQQQAISAVNAMTNMCIKVLLFILLIAFLVGCASGPTTVTKGKRVEPPRGQIVQCVTDPDQPACQNKSIPEVDIKP